MEHRPRPFPALTEALAALAFAGVWLWLALRGLPGGPTEPLDLSAFAQPFGALAALTGVVAVAVLVRAGFRLRHTRDARPEAPQVGAALTGALVMGALWPLVLAHSLPLALLAAGTQVAMALRALGAAHGGADALPLSRLAPDALRRRAVACAPVAIFAGWSMAVVGVMIAVVADHLPGVPPGVAPGLGLLAMAFLTLAAQLSARLVPELSVTVIWALIGTVATQIGTDLPATMIATAAVSLLAVGIVRVTS